MLLLALLSAVAFSRTTLNGFIKSFDDGVYILSNPHVREGLTLSGVKWAFTTAYASNWHPLTWISHMLDWQIWGANAAGHHLTSLVLHIANALLLYLILCYMTKRPARSMFVAALFALHPLHVESVAWVAERKDVLSTFFGMLTILAYLGYVRRPRIRAYLMVVAAFALGLLSKPMLVSLPLLLLLLDYWPIRRDVSFGKLILEKIPLFAMAAGSSIATMWAQRHGGAVVSFDALPLGVRAANAAVSCIEYLAKMIWPCNLAIYYPHPAKTLPSWIVIGSAALIVTAFLISGLFAKRKPYITVGWLWYVVTLTPVIGLVQVGGQAMADRYTYIPLIGPFIAFTWLIADAWAAVDVDSRWKRTVPIVAAGAIILACTARTYVEVGYWYSGETAFKRAIAVTKNNIVAQHDLAEDLMRQDRIFEAEGHFETILKLNPNNKYALENVGFIANRKGDSDRALSVYGTLLRICPESLKAREGMGIALAAKGELAKAIECYRQELEINPNAASAHYNLGNSLFRSGRLDEAAEEYRESIRLKPNQARAHHNLGTYYERKGQTSQALGEYQAAVGLNPNDPQMRIDLAATLFSVGDYSSAWEQVHSAMKLGGEPDPVLIRELQKKMPEPR